MTGDSYPIKSALLAARQQHGNWAAAADELASAIAELGRRWEMDYARYSKSTAQPRPCAERLQAAPMISSVPKGRRALFCLQWKESATPWACRSPSLSWQSLDGKCVGSEKVHHPTSLVILRQQKLRIFSWYQHPQRATRELSLPIRMRLSSLLGPLKPLSYWEVPAPGAQPGKRTAPAHSASCNHQFIEFCNVLRGRPSKPGRAPVA